MTDELLIKEIRQGIIDELKNRLPSMTYECEEYRCAHLHLGDGKIIFHLRLDTASIIIYKAIVDAAYFNDKREIDMNNENFIDVIQSELILSRLNTRINSKLIRVGGE